MHIVTVSNNQYTKYLAVMLTSLLEKMDKNIEIKIYVIDGNISNENKVKLENVLKRFNKKITFLKVDQQLFKSFTVNKLLNHISSETYYRILIPDLLSQDITKALYLDCDLLINSDITELWNTDITNYFLAAVEDPLKSRKADLHIPTDSKYFNAGLLLINLEKWRVNNISLKIMNFIKENPAKLYFMDQDALNAILYDKWVELDYKWNYTTGHWPLIHINSPNIVHFTGSSKPWNSLNHPYRDKYLKYLSSLQWD